PRACTSPPACGWPCGARTCGRRPPPSARSAGSRARPRARCRGFRSAAACAGAPFAEMETREVLRAAAPLTLRPVRAEGEHARRSALVVTPDHGGEVLVER